MNPVSPTDFELLSAYMDGQLAPADKAALETRLPAEPALREALDELRSMAAALRDLPDLRAPRDFRLTPAQVRPARRIVALPAFVSGLSAVAAAVLLVAGLGLLRPLTLPAPATEQMSVAAAPTVALTLSEIPPESAAARQVDTPSPSQALNDVIEATDERDAAGVMLELPSGAAEVAQPQAASPAVVGGAANSEAADLAAAPDSSSTGALMFAQPTPPASVALNQTQATVVAPEDATRTKEGTPTAAPSATETLAPARSATPALPPENTPAPLQPASTVADVQGASVSLTGLVLVMGGVILLGVSLLAWRRARRGR
ncbi:MAG TPA: hypothetical protein VER79_07075 [Candidatus Limnocylindrales bacterium]|nr:hypothetical protein [Candidatus Limnocylindrales bacterium]